MSWPLPAGTIDTLARFVPRPELEAMRVHAGGVLGRVPLFFRAGAMTFGSRVLIRAASYRIDTAWGLALLAHESRHVRQWRDLGVADFLARYGRGLGASGLGHGRHPIRGRAQRGAAGDPRRAPRGDGRGVIRAAGTRPGCRVR
ncbi:MAG: DUF4157 domain-containing protein [Chloroflexi bacterium]|nr:DUF4157 domain-containing protein [Chloroflexota bacterium]